MLRSILVPLDGSPFAEHALPLAIHLAKRAAAVLHLVQVHVPVLAIESVNLLDDRLDATLFEREREYLEGVVRRVKDHVNVPVRSAQPIGGVAEQLIDEARRSSADLIVMTTHGRGALSRFWLGSIADETIRHGPAPVLLVRPGDAPVDFDAAPTIGRILVPLDGAPAAERVLIPAVDIAGLTQAEFTLLEVIPPVPVLGYDLGGYAAAGTDLALLERLEANAHTYLDRAKEWLRARGFRADARVIINEQPAVAILDEAKACACDLIAIETHGRSGLSRMLLGSVADKVVRGTGACVLVHRGLHPSTEAAPADASATSAEHAASSPRGVGILP
jgi:nucleotide-binding universal stress UspA family protein